MWQPYKPIYLSVQSHSIISSSDLQVNKIKEIPDLVLCYLFSSRTNILNPLYTNYTGLFAALKHTRHVFSPTESP